MGRNTMLARLRGYVKPRPSNGESSALNRILTGEGGITLLEAVIAVGILTIVAGLFSTATIQVAQAILVATTRLVELSPLVRVEAERAFDGLAQRRWISAPRRRRGRSPPPVVHQGHHECHVHEHQKAYEDGEQLLGGHCV